MTIEAIPDIPRWSTAIAEWGAAVVYISLMRPRFGRLAHFVIIALALPVMVMLQLVAGQLPISFWVAGMGSATLAMFGFVLLTSQVAAADAGYLTARAFVLAELIASLEWQLWVHWKPEPITLDLPARFLALGIGTFVIVFATAFTLVFLFERRILYAHERPGVDAPAVTSAVAIAVGTFLVSNLSFISTNTPFSGTGEMNIFYIRTLVDLAGFVALYTQQSYRNQIRNSLELAETQLVMQLQHEQYLQSKRNIDELNRMHHDLRYFADAIRAEGSADRRSEYLTQMQSSIRGYETEIQTGNNVLDVILTAKMEKCLQEDITMTTVVDGAALNFIDLPKLSALFGNALDNAIEASRQVDDADQRLINVSVFTRSGFVMVRIENFWNQPVAFDHGGFPRTTKKNRHRHGYGSRSIRRVIESLGGTVTFAHEHQRFSVRGLIPLPLHEASELSTAATRQL